MEKVTSKPRPEKALLPGPLDRLTVSQGERRSTPLAHHAVRKPTLATWNGQKERKKKKKKRFLEFLLWRSGLMIWLISVEALVQFPALHSGLRIWLCCSCGIHRSSGSDSVSAAGTSVCLRYSQKRTKKKKKFLGQEPS